MERIAYHGNEWILVRSLHREAGEYLSLVRALPRPAERPLVSAVSDNLLYLDQRLVNDQNRAAWQSFASRTYTSQTHSVSQSARRVVMHVMRVLSGDHAGEK